MSDIKCPICQNNLHKINMVVSTCKNDKCKLWGSSIPNLVLEALMDTKEKLDIARSAFRYIADGNLGISPAMDFAEKALEQITVPEQKD